MFFKKSYRIPKFREKIETELKKYEELLIDVKKENQMTNFQKKKKKYSKKIKEMLVKPNEWYEKIMTDFTKSIEIIFPFFETFL